MGTNETTRVVLDLDNKEFVEKMKESLGLVGELGKTDSIKELMNTFIKVGELAAVAATAILAIKTAIEFVEEAEKVKQLETAFELLSESVGVSADKIRKELTDAAAGMVTQADLLASANKGIVELGKNAAKLPEIMELARKVTAVFGGDLIQNFDQMNLALSTGRVRWLQQHGVIIDTNKALKDYAASGKIGVEFLTDAEKKQAIFNAAMAEATKRFKEVDPEITKTHNNLQRMSVAFAEIKEITAKAFDSMMGPLVEFASGPNGLRLVVSLMGQLIDHVRILEAGFKAIIVAVAATGDVINGTINNISKLSQGIWAVVTGNEALKKSLRETKEGFGTMNLNATEKAYQSLVDTVTAKPALKSLLADLDAAEKKSKEIGKTGGTSGGTDKPTGDKDKILTEQQKFEKQLLEIRKQRLVAEEELETQFENFKKIRDEEEINLKKEAELKIETLEKQGHAKGLVTDAQFAQAKLDINRKLEGDIQKIRLKSNQDEITALKNLENQTQHTAAGFAAAWKKGGAEASVNLKSFAKLGEISFKAVGGQAVSAFKAMGDGSKSGSDIMKGFILGSLGEIAMEWGTFHLLNGIATYDAIEVAEGGALIALGAALSAMGSGSGSTASSSADTSGSSGGSNYGPPDSGINKAQPVSAAQKKSVTVAIHGNYFETDQTRTRLMEMIREAGDFTDFNLKQIGQP